MFLSDDDPHPALARMSLIDWSAEPNHGYTLKHVWKFVNIDDIWEIRQVNLLICYNILNVNIQLILIWFMHIIRILYIIYVIT